MKFTHITWIIILISAFCTKLKAADVRIKLQVRNYQTNAVYLQQANLDEGQLTKSHRIDLSTEGEAEFVYPVPSNGFIEVNYNGYLIPVYLTSTSSLSISFDANDIASTLQFSGVGSVDNNFIAEFERQSGGTQMTSMECAYLDLKFTENLQVGAGQKSARDFASSISQRYQSQQQVLSAHKSGISHTVYNFYSQKAKYQAEADKLFSILQRWNQLDASTLQQEKAALQLGQGISNNDATAIKNPFYKNFLKAKAIYNYLPNDPYKYRAYKQIYAQIESDLSGESACYMTTHLLVKVYEKSGESELGRSKISQLQNTCPQYTDIVMQMYGGDISGVEDIAAAEIDMINKQGNLVGIEDYKGKVVYLSFWASWCKPCIAGFKKSKDIRQKLQDMGVVLLNISIDKKEEAWRDAMLRHNPLGINTWAISLPSLAKNYDISSIPLYHIIDKQGKFAYLSESGNRDIVEEFRTLVQQ